MKTIVITGSTRGIGYALARSFLKRGCKVVISGRKQNLVNVAVNRLQKEFSPEKVAGYACDVADFSQVEILWGQSVKKFGPLDIWINNAGISNTQNPPWDLPADEIECVVKTNMLGEMFGSKIALSGFIKQGYGALYNMEGMGAQRRRGVKGLSIYGATKAGLKYFNDSIFSEVEKEKIIIGAIQPGMMLTEMITDQYLNRREDWEKVKGIFSVISEKPEVVAEWLADRILNNSKNGVRFTYGGMLRMISRLVRNQFRKKSKF
jgi:NAD(P)-dependent dehydrogenase (short-subunit alcohol dehydrogenase family)